MYLVVKNRIYLLLYNYRNMPERDYTR